jgi:transketolase
MITPRNYDAITKESRLKVLDLLYAAQTSHVGSLMGAAEIFTTVFGNVNLDRDSVVLSAGWKAALLYFHLYKHGRITLEQLESYCMPGSKFIGLAEPIIPDIQIAGGSMGLGFPGAVGLALARRLHRDDGRVICIMSDGEMAIGTTHEAALIAAHHNLENLTVIVDCNGQQAMGATTDILTVGCGLQPGRALETLWKAWGWETAVVDGHSTDALDQAIDADVFMRPNVIIANTVKGKGVSFMEGNNLYHYKQLSTDEYLNARKEVWEK